MFDSLKDKLRSLVNPFKRRSVSICVESKAKKIQSKRDHSQQRSNYPQQVEITPKKITHQEHQRILFDQMETVSKDNVSAKNFTRLFQNRNNNSLDFVSDIQSEQQSQTLLPNTQQLKSIKKQASKKISKIKQIQKMQSLNQVNIVSKNCKQENQNPLINWLQQNKPDYFMIKLNKQSKQKQITGQAKRKRLQDYQKQKRQQIKPKPKSICIICQQTALIKQSIILACLHRIHKKCADIIRWKPKMKCNLCQRRSVKQLVFHKLKSKPEPQLINSTLKNK